MWGEASRISSAVITVWYVRCKAFLMRHEATYQSIEAKMNGRAMEFKAKFETDAPGFGFNH